MDDSFLKQRHGLRTRFHRKVAAGDHDAVRDGDDLFQSLNGFRAFDLGYDRRLRTVPLHIVPGGENVLRTSDERQCDVIHAVRQAERQVFPVLVAEGRCRYRDARKVHPLMGRDDASGQYAAEHAGLFRALHDQFDKTVVDQYPVPGLHIGRKLSVGDRYTRSRAIGRHTEHDGRTGFDRHRLCQRADPDPRPLKVLKDRDRTFGGGRRFPDGPNRVGVAFVRAVGEIQPGEIEPGGDQLAKDLWRIRRRADGTDDLGAPHPGILADRGSVDLPRGACYSPVPL